MYPLLLYLFEHRVKGDSGEINSTRIFSATTNAMLQTCSESCVSIIKILAVLRKHDLLGEPRIIKYNSCSRLDSNTEVFIPFDLERIFASSFVYIMLSFIRSEADGSHSLKIESKLILGELINKGSIPAQYRMVDLNHLEKTIALWESQRVNKPAEAIDGSQLVLSDAETVLSPHASRESHGQETELEGSDFGIWGVNMTSASHIHALAQMVSNQQGMMESELAWGDSWLWTD